MGVRFEAGTLCFLFALFMAYREIMYSKRERH